MRTLGRSKVKHAEESEKFRANDVPSGETVSTGIFINSNLTVLYFMSGRLRPTLPHLLGRRGPGHALSTAYTALAIYYRFDD
jgi:hypothetical protein